jgi:NAD(P)-dependent dehydrogenase (short-subunit alcohol dehydrogenase family)
MLSEIAVAVVTGGSSGNGRAISLALAREGIDVVIADVQAQPRDGGTPTHELVETETDAEAEFVDCDVRNLEDLREVMDVADSYGGVDLLVNNAGVVRDTDFHEVTEKEYDFIMDVNVKGSFFASQLAAERMIARGDGGNIVNLSSVAGLRGADDLVAYSVSKGAVRLLTYALAGALGPEGIRVNAIHPGPIDTPMARDDISLFEEETIEQYQEANPLGRAGTTEDVSDAVLLLASDYASYVNGESLVLDGGMYNTK